MDMPIISFAFFIIPVTALNKTIDYPWRIFQTMAKPEFDFIVVGQGVAGSSLAWFLMQRGKRVLVVDNGHQSCASNVAIGLINPILGRSMNIPWRCSQIFPALKPIYQGFEKSLHARLIYERVFYRLFIDQKQRTKWLKKQDDDAYQPFLTQKTDSILMNEWMNAPFGGFAYQGGFWIDTVQLVQAFRAHFLAMGNYREHEMSSTELEVREEHVLLNGITASHLIFCEGSHGAANPYFRWVPFALTKGEVLGFESDELDTDAVIIRNGFLTRGANDKYFVGVTHDRHDLSPTQTPKGRELLASKLAMIVRTPCNILAQKAGIRPATTDGKPVLGRHFQHQRLGFFNGLGGKGFSLGPYYARQMADFLVENKPVDPEVALSRFYP